MFPKRLPRCRCKGLKWLCHKTLDEAFRPVTGYELFFNGSLDTSTEIKYWSFYLFRVKKKKKVGFDIFRPNS